MNINNITLVNISFLIRERLKTIATSIVRELRLITREEGTYNDDEDASLPQDLDVPRCVASYVKTNEFQETCVVIVSGFLPNYEIE